MALGAIYVPKAANEPKPSTEATPTPSAEVEQKPTNDGSVKEVGANEAPSNTDDLMSRITQFEVEQNPANKPPEVVDAELFNDKEFRAEIDRVKATNPELAKHMELLRKSAISGVNSKFQQIAEMRKQLEALSQNKQGAEPKFKANSIDELLNNPTFMEEAKAKLGSSNSPISEESGISDETKQYIQSLEAKLKAIEDGFVQKQSQEANMEWNRQHEVLSARYKNYDKSKVDEVANGLITGKVKATPEYIYKVVYHDDNVRRAYELGRKEGMKTLTEKKQLNNGIESVNAVPLTDIKQEKEENNLTFMQKIIAKRLAGAK